MAPLTERSYGASRRAGPGEALRAGAGRLLVAVLDARGAVGGERQILLGVRRAPLAEPAHGARDALVERRLRLPLEQVVRLADVGHVVGHLAEERRRLADPRLHAELGGDQLRGAHERVALAVREVDRLVRDPAVGEAFDAAGDAVD